MGGFVKKRGDSMPETTNSTPSRVKKLQLSPQDRVEHKVFGCGTVTQISTQRTTVDFDEAGTKTFVTSMARFEKSDTPAPPTRSRRKKKTTTKKTAAKKKTATKKKTTKKS
jgi:hypothetical protein